MVPHAHPLLWLVTATCLTTTYYGFRQSKSTAADAKAVNEVLAKFEKGDPGWKVRMKALIQTTAAGADAVPVLVESLETGVPSVREFAAQALSVMTDSRSEPALTKALDDPNRAARIYAVRALSGLGKLKLTDSYRQAMGDASATWGRAPWMEDYLLAAEDPQHASDPSLKRKALLDYDLSKMETARLRQLAPDFVLKDRDGHDVRLSDFRGQAAVVLEFNDGGG